jgi:osmoprotectant transport system substrate-binding protein
MRRSFLNRSFLNRSFLNRRFLNRRSAIGAVAAVALLAGCGTNSSSSSSKDTVKSSGDKGSVTIAAANFGENTILANMYADVLNKAGFKTTIKKLTNREVIEPALEKGEIQLVPEYLSTLTEFLNDKKNGPSAKPLASPDVTKTLAALQTLAGPRKLKALTPSKATDQNAFAVTQVFASKNKLTKLSDLASYKGKLILGGPPECPKRPFCQPGLEKTYGISFTGFKALDAGGPLTKTALQQGKIQLGEVFTSDAGIDALKLKALADDKHLQNADNVVPVINTKVDKPALVTALNGLSAVLTTDDLIAVNKKVDVDRGDPAKVALDYLKSKGLV